MAFIADKRMLLDYTQKNLVSIAEKQLGERQRKYVSLCASLDALSPLKVLGRGYAMARTADGQVLKSAADVAVGDKIDVTLGQGRLDCVVEARDLGGTDNG